MPNESVARASHEAYHRLLFGFGLTLAAVYVLRNAWVAEDAYILFRSLEQLLAGNGPRWNPHERVQVYTSPLWFWVLAAVRYFSADVFLNAVLVGWLCSLATVILARPLAQDDTAWLIWLATLLAADSFMDYTTSGLENALGYLLLVLWYRSVWPCLTGQASSRQVWIQILLLGLIPLLRHDLLLLVCLPGLVGLWRSSATVKILLGRGLLWVLPLALWSLFALIYYGHPLPNTALAKLGSGLSREALLEQGIKYLLVTALFDPITMVVIGYGTLAALLAPHRVWIGLGMLLQLTYVVTVGGDFMQGRFFSFALLLASLDLLHHGVGLRVDQPWCVLQFQWHRRRPGQVLLLIAVVGYGLLFPVTPLNSHPSHRLINGWFGIVDERHFYFPYTSLWRYAAHGEGPFPESLWNYGGRAFAVAEERCVVWENIGLFGYESGTDKVIIDSLALADPLLARLPAIPRPDWRIGHFQRSIPHGYRPPEGVIDDPDLRRYHQALTVLTEQEPLLSVERLGTLIRFHLGFYNHYRDAYLVRLAQLSPQARQWRPPGCADPAVLYEGFKD